MLVHFALCTICQVVGDIPPSSELAAIESELAASA